MATPTPPPDPTPPRASLLSRPAEIKAFIVRLARWQDFAYAERLAAVEPGAKAVGVMVETKWLGRSANPLYHVNKELSVLAAVSLFEVIKASRCSEPFFKFRSHVFSRHIREIDFDKDTTAHDAIVALSCLTLVAPPHLTRLPITPSSAEHLLHALFHPLSIVDFSDEAVCVVESFRLLASRIIDLTLVNFTAQKAEVLLPLFLHLQSLRFTGQTTFGDDMDVLSGALAGLALRSLDCCLCSGTEPYGTTPEWVTSPWASVGTLSHLRIFTGELEADPWAFIERFAGTLKTLDLACEEFSADHPPLLAIQFPQLTPLTLRTPFPAATSLLSLLATSPLLTLHLSLFDDEEIHDAPITSSLHAIPSHSPSPMLHQQESFSHALGEWSPYSYPVFAESPLFAHTCSSLDDVVAFGAERAAAVRRDGDIAEARTLLEHTKGIQSLQVIWRD